jgi:hypothetical protein
LNGSFSDDVLVEFCEQVVAWRRFTASDGPMPEYQQESVGATRSVALLTASRWALAELQPRA